MDNPLIFSNTLSIDSHWTHGERKWKCLCGRLLYLVLDVTHVPSVHILLASTKWHHQPHCKEVEETDHMCDQHSSWYPDLWRSYLVLGSVLHFVPHVIWQFHMVRRLNVLGPDRSTFRSGSNVALKIGDDEASRGRTKYPLIPLPEQDNWWYSLDQVHHLLNLLDQGLEPFISDEIHLTEEQKPPSLLVPGGSS